MIKRNCLLGFIICLLILLPNIVKAENVIYDNITSSNYKIIKIEDNLNINYINEYQYEVYLNNFFFGYFKKDELIYIPDNSNITIIIPSPIKTSTDNIWNLSIKPQLFTMIGFILSWGLLIVILCYGIYRVQRKIRKGY